MSESVEMEKDSQNPSPESVGEGNASTEGKDPQKKTFDLGPAVELIKTVGGYGWSGKPCCSPLLERKPHYCGSPSSLQSLRVD